MYVQAMNTSIAMSLTIKVKEDLFYQEEMVIVMYTTTLQYMCISTHSIVEANSAFCLLSAPFDYVHRGIPGGSGVVNFVKASLSNHR